MPGCLHQLFEAAAREHPGRVALQSRRRQMTYGELDHAAEQFARRLRLLGVGAEVVVGLADPLSFALIVELFGILKAGGAYLALDASYPNAVMRDLARRAGVDLIATTTEQQRWRELGFAVVGCGDGAATRSARSRGAPRAVASSSDLACLMLTAGTSGTPKLVAVSHGNAHNVVHFSARRLFAAGDLAVVPLFDSLCFDPSINQIFAPLSVGGRLVVLGHAETFWTAGPRYGFTYFGAVPSLLGARWPALAVPPTLRAVGLGAEPIADDFLARIFADTPATRITNFYGPTETTVYSTSRVFERGAHRGSRRRRRRTAGAGREIGAPVQHTTVALLEPGTPTRARGRVGELGIAGRGLTRGYLDGGAATARRFAPNGSPAQPGARIFLTGDRVRARRGGGLEFLGRTDLQVKIRGCRVEPEGIEAVLRRHPAVVDARVVATSGDPATNALVAYLVRSPGRWVVTPSFSEHLRRHLPAPMIPSTYVFVEAMPLLPSGKADRAELARRADAMACLR